MSLGLGSGGGVSAASLAGFGLSPLGNVGQRIFGGRTENSYTLATGGTGTGRSFSVMTVAASASFSAVRAIFATGYTSGAITPTASCAFAALPDTTDASISAANYQLMTFSGAGTTTLAPSPSSGRRAIYFSDWMAFPSVPRTDGGTFPILHFITGLYTSGASGPVVMLGSSGGGDSFTNWASRPDGRFWTMRGKGGVFSLAGTGNAMTGAASIAENRCPLIGFQYIADGKVLNVSAYGDSITEGRGTYIGEGFNFPACIDAQTALGIPVEYSNLGWSGQTTAQVSQNITDALAAGVIGDLAIIPAFSPNDISTTITDAQITAMRGNLGLSLVQLKSKGIKPIIWTGLPSNTAAKAYGATDAKRTAFNDAIKGWATRGQTIADLATPISGAADGTGQIQMAAGSTSDNIHPNDTGSAVLKVPTKNAIVREVLAPVGTVV